MNDKIIKLLQISSKLEDKGFCLQSRQIDSCAESLNFIKQAQYEGIQGHWIRNTRCWQNCYRHKRADNPDRPIQEIWNECHSEYVDSLYGDSGGGWGKYASDSSDGIKISSSDQKRLIDIQFDNLVDNLLAEGNSLEESISGAIVKQCSSYTDLVSEVSISILKVAESVQHDNFSDSIALVNIGDDLTKEAQGFLRKMLDTLRGGASYGKDALGDSRVRGTLARLSNTAVVQLKNINDSISKFNNTISNTLDAARQASGSGSSRLSNAGNQTLSLLSGVSVDYDVYPVLEKLRGLPYSKFMGGFTPTGETETTPTEPAPEVEEVETPEGAPEETVLPEAPSSSGDPGEFISDNIDVAKEVAGKLIQDMGQSEQGQRSLQEIVAGLGLRLASSHPIFNLLNKESQHGPQSRFSDWASKLEELDPSERTDLLKARRRSIESREGKGREMKLDMMSGLAKRNPYRFLTEVMNVMGKPQFVSFLNEAISSDIGRGSGGKFRKKTKGTFEDIGGSLDL